MVFTNPVICGVFGDAKIIRFLNLPNYSGTVKNFVVYTTTFSPAGDKFLYRNVTEIDFDTDPGVADTIIVPTAEQTINNFYVLESNVDNEVIFVYDDGVDVYYLIYDFESEEVVEGPVNAYPGTIPALVRTVDIVNVIYTLQRQLYFREDVVGSAVKLLDYSGYRVQDYDFFDKGSSTKAYFAGEYDLYEGIALEFRNDGDTTILYSCIEAVEIGGDRVLEDLSGNGYHCVIDDDDSVSYDGGYIQHTNVFPQINSWYVGAAGAHITLEAWIKPRLLTDELSYILDGDIRFYFDRRGWLGFEFDGVSTHVFLQKGLHSLRLNTFNHVAFSHTFGDGSDTFMTINGTPVLAEWISGSGAEDPIYGSINSTIELAKFNALRGFQIRNVRRTETEIRNYVRGRT